LSSPDVVLEEDADILQIVLDEDDRDGAWFLAFPPGRQTAGR
jgi:hypothetical protein